MRLTNANRHPLNVNQPLQLTSPTQSNRYVSSILEIFPKSSIELQKMLLGNINTLAAAESADDHPLKGLAKFLSAYIIISEVALSEPETSSRTTFYLKIIKESLAFHQSSAKYKTALDELATEMHLLASDIINEQSIAIEDSFNHRYDMTSRFAFDSKISCDKVMAKNFERKLPYQLKDIDPLRAKIDLSNSDSRGLLNSYCPKNNVDFFDGCKSLANAYAEAAKHSVEAYDLIILDPGSKKHLSTLLPSLSENSIRIALIAAGWAFNALAEVSAASEIAELERLIGSDKVLPLRQQAEFLTIDSTYFSRLYSSFSKDKLKPFNATIFTELRNSVLDYANAGYLLEPSPQNASISAQDAEKAQTIVQVLVSKACAVADHFSFYIDTHAHINPKNENIALKSKNQSTIGAIIKYLTNPKAINNSGQGSRTIDLDEVGISSSDEFSDNDAVDDITLGTYKSTLDEVVDSAASKLDAIMAKSDKLIEKTIELESSFTNYIGYNDPDRHLKSLQSLSTEFKSVATKIVAHTLRIDKFITEAQNEPELVELTRKAFETEQHLSSKLADIQEAIQNIDHPSRYFSLVKAYKRPQVSQWLDLLGAGQVQQVSLPRALPSNPANTLFEIKIQPLPDADATSYDPVWIHLHTHAPMKETAVPRAAFERFSAVHMKSHAAKNRGKNWVDNEAAQGRYAAQVFRSPVSKEALQAFMNRALSDEGGQKQAAKTGRSKSKKLL